MWSAALEVEYAYVSREGTLIPLIEPICVLSARFHRCSGRRGKTCVDDARGQGTIGSCTPQERNELLCEGEDSLHVEREQFCPCGVRVGFEIVPPCRPGIVHEHMQYCHVNLSMLPRYVGGVPFSRRPSSSASRMHSLYSARSAGRAIHCPGPWAVKRAAVDAHAEADREAM